MQAICLDLLVKCDRCQVAIDEYGSKQYGQSEMAFLKKFCKQLWAKRQSLAVWIVPAIILTISVFSMIIEQLQNGISRRFERQSDRYALQRIGQRAGDEHSQTVPHP